jgi:hypothetical protein
VGNEDHCAAAAVVVAAAAAPEQELVAVDKESGVPARGLGTLTPDSVALTTALVVLLMA